jgi:uncharacterized protein (TIGR03437 family)
MLYDRFGRGKHMDAAHKLYKNSCLLFTSLALVLAAPAWAQTPSLSLNTNTVSLNQSVLFGSVNVTSTGAAITYMASISGLSDNGGNGIWLKLTSPATQTTPDAVGVQINNTSGMVAGNYTATVTLTPSAPTGVAPVSFTVNWANGGGGGGGGNTISLSQNTLSLSAASGSGTSGSITVSTTSATNIQLGLTATPTTCGNNWLSVGSNTNTINNGTSASLTISASAANIANGTTCTGTVTVSPSPGTPASIAVTFSVGGGGGGGVLNVTPGSFTFNFSTNGGFPSQALTLTDSAGATQVSATSNVPWLLINNNATIIFAPGAALTASLSAAANTLATGQYTGTISFTDNLNNQATVSVTLNVNGGSTGLTVNPTSLSFSSAVSGPVQSNNVTVISTTGGAFTATPNMTWISATPSVSNLASNTQGSVQIVVTPGGLPAATYNGAVLISVGGQQQSVGITLTIGSGGGGGGSGSVAPNSVTVSYQAGTDPGFVSRPDIVVTGTSGNWSSTSSQPWLSLSPSGGATLPAQPTIAVNPTGMAAGNYSGTLTITTPDGVQTVTVTLAVSSSAVLTSRPGSTVFYYQTSGAIPAGQSVFFSVSDISLNASLDLTGAVTANAPWISVATFQKSIQVSVDPRGLTNGVNSGTITLNPSGLGTYTFPVVLVINNGAGGGGSTGPLSFSPSSMTFTAATGSNPPAQTLAVTANVQTSFTVSSNQQWLTVSASSATTPANLSVNVASSTLAAGTYNGVLSFTSGGTTQNYSVTLTVSGSSGGSGNVTVTPTSLTFTGQTPAGTLPVQTFQVNSASGSSGVGFTMTVTTSSGGGWLTTSPAAGQSLTTPTTVSVTANGKGLDPGTYQGNIHIAPNGGTAVDIPVTMTLAAPASVSATPTSLSFTFRGGGDTPAAQSISVSGAGSALAFTATATSNGNWLQVTPASGTTPATLSASVNPTGLSAGTYAGTIVVAGSGSATGSTTINVTLTVTAPLPTITKLTNGASYATGNISPGLIFTLFGTDLGPATPAGLQLDTNGKVATTLSGVQVTVAGIPAPLIYVSNTQISAVVPYELAQFTTASVLVKYLGQSSNGISTNVATTMPGVFTLNASGTGPGAILNSNGSVNSPSAPAQRGDTIVVYLTGEGQTTPAGVTGKVTTVSSTPPLTPAPLLPIAVLIDGQPANYTFAGEAPGFVSGVMQLNVVVPQAAGSGAKSITVSIGGRPSQSGVTVSIQ